MPVQPRIRSDRPIRDHDPGIREGQLRGGGTILGNGARTGPGVTAAIHPPRNGARGGRAPRDTPRGPYPAFNAAPPRTTPSPPRRPADPAGFPAPATTITL